MNIFKKWWFYVLLVGVVLIIIFSFFTSNEHGETNDAGQVKQIIEGKGYEYIDSSYIFYNNQNIARLEIKDYDIDSNFQVLACLQTLDRVYKNASVYQIEIQTNKEACSYIINASEYHYYRSFEEWGFEAYYWLKESINQSEVCKQY